MVEEKRKKCITLQNTMLMIFVALIVITVSLVCFLVFSNWLSSSKKTTRKIAEETNAQVLRQVEDFIISALHVNEINQKFITNGIVDLNQEQERDKFFVSVLTSHGSDFYSFSFGTESGEYYGARRNEKGEIEVMRNNARTGGHSWYYSVREDYTAGELVLAAGKFDPRTREWYKAAKETGAPVFSPVYRHFVMPDMTLSAA